LAFCVFFRVAGFAGIQGPKTGDTVNLLGSQATADLDGNERGRFEVDTATGMLMSGETKLSLEGKVQVMGRDVPVRITSERKVKGKRIR
jgi:hypothetical protein